MITAAILSSALRKVLPGDDFVLVNPGYGYVNGAAGPEHIRDSMEFIRRGAANPNLLFSMAVPVATIDQKSPWLIWAGRDDAVFLDGPDMRALRGQQWAGYSTVAVLALALALCWYFYVRNTSGKINHGR